ncbi:MAG: CidA/LrgA family protein [Hungatella sp.]
MNYIKQICIIFGITMIGEVLNAILPLPIPAGVYGLFLMLFGLCSGIIKIRDVEDVGNFLLDTMPMMFIPVSVGLIKDYDVMKTILLPLIVISVLSTMIVMVVTGKFTEWILSKTWKRGKRV